MKFLKVVFSKVVLVCAVIAVQLAILILLIWTLHDQFVYIYAIFLLMSCVLLVVLYSKHDNPSVKLPWVIVMLHYPILGGLLYLLIGCTRLSKKVKVGLYEQAKKTEQALSKNEDLLEELEGKDKHIASQSRYISHVSSMPVYQNTSVQYLEMGEIAFGSMLEQLEKAKHFIFLEFYVIQEGVMWNTILDLLVKKAKQGVDVRVMYDDGGCIKTLPSDYTKKLELMGIRAAVFNPIRPLMFSAIVNRGHRKIVVIDGDVGFTGGFNLADEYINEYEKFGHWKDTGVLLQGDAVWSLTLLFLQSWNFYRQTDEDYAIFKPKKFDGAKAENGFIQPYGDSPYDGELIGEMVYLNIINNATDYLYINSPYFNVDNEMVTALTLAAKRGVDVCITLPHIPDKWYIDLVTKSYYSVLIKAGIKVFEYTPGFIHAKSFVADDEVAVVGSVNLNYSSLYHLFECGVWMYKADAILLVKQDYLKTLEECSLVTMEVCKDVSCGERLLRGFLRLFAPLM